MPFVFLERVKDDFRKRYGASIANAEKETDPLADDDEIDDLFEDRFSIAYNLDREFGFVSITFFILCIYFLTNLTSILSFLLFTRPILKEHMEYCMNHPEEISKLSKLRAQISEVKGVMIDNIEKVWVWMCELICFVKILSREDSVTTKTGGTE